MARCGTWVQVHPDTVKWVCRLDAGHHGEHVGGAGQRWGSGLNAALEIKSILDVHRTEIEQVVGVDPEPLRQVHAHFVDVAASAHEQAVALGLTREGPKFEEPEPEPETPETAIPMPGPVAEGATVDVPAVKGRRHREPEVAVAAS